MWAMRREREKSLLERMNELLKIYQMEGPKGALLIRYGKMDTFD